MVSLRPSLGSPANDDVLAATGRFAANSLSGHTVCLQDFAVGNDGFKETGGVPVPVAGLSTLPAPERIQRYLVRAERERWEAGESKEDSARESYLFITEQWGKLALDLALHLTRQLQIDMKSRPRTTH